MSEKEFPFVSVVVVTFNRSAVMAACLESLAAQTYPHDRYEVILVDDGSTDDTAAVAKVHGAQVIHHEANRGIPAARNTGLAAAKGNVVAYIDDDAVANVDWLENLVQPFTRPEVSATGGRTFAFKTEYIAERYLAANEYGNPAPLGFGESKHPLRRFVAYIKNMFAPVSVSSGPVEVQAVFGLNCAFRTATLRAVGGYDVMLQADEDSEISTRLRAMGAHIIFVPTAVIRHRHRESLSRLITQTFARSQYTVPYYAKEKKTLPIFPFPLIYLAISAGLFLCNPLWAVLFILLGPLLLYCWWPLRAITHLQPEYLVYSYVQLALESASISGMLKGAFITSKQTI